MNTKDAVYHTAHDSPGGVPALAVRMGVSANVLQNKVNPTQEHHKLTLDEAVRMQALTGDVRILHAMASELGYVAVHVQPFEGVSDMELLDGYMDAITALGEFTASFQLAIADGRVTKHEAAALEDKSYTFIQRHLALMARLRGMAE